MIAYIFLWAEKSIMVNSRRIFYIISLPRMSNVYSLIKKNSKRDWFGNVKFCEWVNYKIINTFRVYVCWLFMFNACDMRVHDRITQGSMVKICSRSGLVFVCSTPGSTFDFIFGNILNSRGVIKILRMISNFNRAYRLMYRRIKNASYSEQQISILYANRNR